MTRDSFSFPLILVLIVVGLSVLAGIVIAVLASPESMRMAALEPGNGPPTSTSQPIPTASLPAQPAHTATLAATTSTSAASPTLSATPAHIVTATSPHTSTVFPAHTAPIANSPTATAAPEIDAAEFVADVTVPDGATFPGNARFVKTWRLKNAGTTTWTTEYSFEHAGGADMPLVSSLNLPQAVEPGETVDISVPMRAPDSPGRKVSLFQLRNSSGTPFGVGANYNDFVYVLIEVLPGPTATPAAEG